jgi:hypothetical protein
MAEADQLALHSSVAPAGILAGHPQHEGSDRWWCGWSAWSSVRGVQRRATSWACQGSSVRGDTSRSWRSGVGSSLLNALSTARSSQVKVGWGLVRRSTAISWRSIRISASLAASGRASSANQDNMRTSIR